MTKDVVFVPKILEDIRTDDKTRLELLLDLAEDSPLVTLARLTRHQLIGWQLYLFFNVTAGKDSLPNGRKLATKADMTHFTISSRLFLPSQQFYILLSDAGILFTLLALYFVAKHNGLTTMMLLYFAPYLWVHHWIDVPHYTAATWTFTQGALGTIDRSFGFIGRHFFHEIIDYHLIHHLFPKIPFYHAEEATKAVMPLLGSTYVDAKQDSFLWSLYTTFRSCRFVTAEPQSKDSAASGKLVWATLVK
ncbi:hypothetical protein LTR64_002137 [Lithohypha guttulata]|uniref:uncharacterized protein n=1 Tax=Lithohypha guttulata TaxID=1690604 RepID=UPI002DE1DDF0|nr:hypothetical protein LTR51_007996 [Lithohypha guttulata]